MDDKLDRALVRGLPAFTGLAEPDLEELLAACTVSTYGAEQPIFAEATDGPALYVLLEGRARVLMTGRNGKLREVGEIEKGAVLGEVSFLLGGNHSATAVATEETRALRLPREEFLRLCDAGRPGAYKLALNLAKALGARLRLVDAKLVELLDQESSTRRQEELEQLKHKLFTEWSF
jgi:CRP-like cAMP-binding protein